jgi:aryl-alcohol dehydrogenase-like predicted oxidoreductase
MDFTTLGRTGLKVSVAGLGCGGSSCLGQTSGQSIDYSVGIIQRALDLGVNYIDTARHYGTEEVIGALLQHVPRDTFTLATKAHHRKGDTLFSAEDIVHSLDQLLKVIKTDCIDVFQLHSIRHDSYDHVYNNIVPALMREREKGKFRFLGATEIPPQDARHLAMQRALDDDI